MFLRYFISESLEPSKYIFLWCDSDVGFYRSKWMIIGCVLQLKLEKSVADSGFSYSPKPIIPIIRKFMKDIWHFERKHIKILLTYRVYSTVHKRWRIRRGWGGGGGLSGWPPERVDGSFKITYRLLAYDLSVIVVNPISYFSSSQTIISHKSQGCVSYFRSYFQSSFYLPFCMFYLASFRRITLELCDRRW